MAGLILKNREDKKARSYCFPQGLRQKVGKEAKVICTSLISWQKTRSSRSTVAMPECLLKHTVDFA